MQIRFSWLNGVENVSNMLQSIQNIIINDRKYILDLYKWHKGRPKKKMPLTTFYYSIKKNSLKIMRNFALKVHYSFKPANEISSDRSV